ncbi:hypothetical protein BX600DRAFT_508630 [Xylariales sp. PMI_506]|nr:hypothetical protein BX600DRAFT_508630 [Xylariales sp. PMI_506]
MDFMEDGNSDIGAIWHQALEDYATESGIDLRSATQMQWNISTIVKDQEQQVSSFTSWRHDKTKVDKIRSVFAKNADIIQSIAGQVASAASASFPPAATILTAFTYVMSAAKGVSDDYNMVESFFDIMNGFLERLSLLESRLPPEKVYQTMLVRVFASILNLSAIARSYRKSGRFSKWAKNLVEHQDSNLKSAYDLLQKHLSRLESMTLMATLKQTMVISKDVGALGGAVSVLGSKMDMSLSLTQQTITLSSQTLNIGLDARAQAEQAALAALEGKEMSAETLAAFKEQQEEFKDLARLIQLRQKEERKADKTVNATEHVDSGDKKTSAMSKLRNVLDCQNYVNLFYEQESDHRAVYVQGTANWVETEQVYRDFVDLKKKLLWITGAPGMGKSMLSFQIAERLRREFSDEPSTSVCSFYIREDYQDLRRLEWILRACALQAASKDSKYRDRLVSDIHPLGYMDDNIPDIFNRLFISKYPKTADSRVIIILDGLDELMEPDALAWKEAVVLALKDEANIQLVLTSDPEHLSRYADVEVNRLDIFKDKIAKDMWKVAIGRTKTLSRLRKLRPEVRKKIASRLKHKADNFCYIEHMARKLNALGSREGLILKELDKLPENTLKLYEMLIEECERHRSPEERSALKVFFAWLAYSKRQVSLGEANRLIQIISEESGISIDEELDGKSSRLLRLANSSAFEGQERDTEASDLEADDQEEDEEDEPRMREDLSLLLGFQERSLRAYFRSDVSDKHGLRSPASIAHKMIFDTICRFFVVLRDEPSAEAERGLIQYGANFWRDHLRAINIDDLNEDEVRSVIESLYIILDNKNNSMKKIQMWTGENSTCLSIFGDDDESSEETLEVIKQLAVRAIHLSSAGGQFSTIQEWFRPLIQNPYRIYIGNARCHIRNWFQTSEYMDQAGMSFRFAHDALLKGYSKQLPELQQNTPLRQYFEKIDPEAWTEMTAESILTVANAFWDVPKSYRAYWSIAMAMKDQKLFEDALTQNHIALEMANDDSERENLYVSLGNTLLELRQDEKYDEAQRTAWGLQACEAYLKAVSIRPASSIKAEDSDDIRGDCAGLHLDYAMAEFLQGNTEKMIALVSDAVTIPDVSLEIYRLVEQIAAAGSWKYVLEVLRLVKKADRAWYLNIASDDKHIGLQKVSLELGVQAELVKIYSESVKFLEQGGFVSMLRIHWADYHNKVLQEPEKAKELLYRLPDCVGSGQYSTTGVTWAIWRIVDILLEQFRSSTNPKSKTAMLDEVKSILLRLKDISGEDFDPSQSQTTMPLALMTRKLGPATEFQRILQESFEGCVANLSDDSSWNDSSSLRTLAKVLSCVEGLEKEAQIAASCQVYVMDMDIYIRDTTPHEEPVEETEDGHTLAKSIDEQGALSEGPSEATTTESATATTANDSSNSVSTSATTVSEGDVEDKPVSADLPLDGSATKDVAEEKPASVEGSPDAVAENVAEVENANPNHDFNKNQSAAICNECDAQITSWEDQSVYMCLQCTDIDICGNCYAERLKRESGELPPVWRTLCPQGHKHLRAPMEGWGGVKNGVITVGEEKFVFTDWLKELKDVKWPKAWDEFWTRESI